MQIIVAGCCNGFIDAQEAVGRKRKYVILLRTYTEIEETLMSSPYRSWKNDFVSIVCVNIYVTWRSILRSQNIPTEILFLGSQLWQNLFRPTIC